MSLWKDNAKVATPVAPTEPKDVGRAEAVLRNEGPAVYTSGRSEPALARKESLIAADISIEGKIEGNGSVRIAGTFKGDVSVQGDLMIESGARVTGSVRADKVIIAGELEGNIDGATRVDLQPGGAITGDVKAGSLTVAAGSRMRGHAVFGWDESPASKASKPNT